jgi:hypothetical protein
VKYDSYTSGMLARKQELITDDKLEHSRNVCQRSCFGCRIEVSQSHAFLKVVLNLKIHNLAVSVWNDARVRSTVIALH